MKKYHDFVCKDQQCIIYEKRFPPVKIQFAPFVGYCLTNHSFKTSIYPYSDVSLNTEYSTFLGLKISATAPSLNEKISLQVTTFFNKQYFYGFTEAEFVYNRTEYNYFHLRFTDLGINGSLKYTYPHGKIRPTIALGAGPLLTLKDDSERIYKMITDGTVYSINKYMHIMPRSYLLFSADLGLDIDITKRRTLFINGIFSFGQGRHTFLRTKHLHQLLGINAGIYF